MFLTDCHLPDVLWVALGRADLTQMTRLWMRGLKLPTFGTDAAEAMCEGLLPAESLSRTTQSPAWGPFLCRRLLGIKKRIVRLERQFLRALDALAVPWSLMPSSGLGQLCMHVVPRYTGRHTRTHKINNKKGGLIEIALKGMTLCRSSLGMRQGGPQVSE